MSVALVRAPSSSMGDGLVTHIERVPAGAALAAARHAAYVSALAGAGDPSPLARMRMVPEEGGSHVVVLDPSTVLIASSAPRSAELFSELGFDVVAVDIGEFEKMEGCAACLSVLVP